MVEAKFSINGMVDKPDIIGAVFGQTEGLLGDDLDLRELQKGGKIGRIEIDLSQTGNRSFGKLHLPASLDRIETCILAAAVESVDRVGPYEAQFSVERVEDTRSEKRRKILMRAKDLLKLLMSTDMPDSKELSELVQSEVRVSEIVAYGPDKLPAGPDVAKNPELIIVEGRADVLNLLKNGITNVVAIGGASAVPKSMIDLCREKDVTVFLDGDRGGDMILRNLLNVADVDFVARAPDGKEVEDLMQKEIIKAIRTKVPLDQYNSGYRGRQPFTQRPQHAQRNEEPHHDSVQHQPPQAEHRPEPRAPPQEQFSRSEPFSTKKVMDDLSDIDDDQPGKIESIGSGPAKEPLMPQSPKPALESIVLSELNNGLNALAGTLRSRLYDNSGTVVKEMPIRDLLPMVQNSTDVYGIVLDGVITQRLVELALQKGIKAIYGLRSNPMSKKHTGIILYTKEGGSEQ